MKAKTQSNLTPAQGSRKVFRTFSSNKQIHLSSDKIAIVKWAGPIHLIVSQSEHFFIHTYSQRRPIPCSRTSYKAVLLETNLAVSAVRATYHFLCATTTYLYLQQRSDLWPSLWHLPQEDFSLHLRTRVVAHLNGPKLVLPFLSTASKFVLVLWVCLALQITEVRPFMYILISLPSLLKPIFQVGFAPFFWDCPKLPSLSGEGELSIAICGDFHSPLTRLQPLALHRLTHTDTGLSIQSQANWACLPPSFRWAEHLSKAEINFPSLVTLESVVGLLAFGRRMVKVGLHLWQNFQLQPQYRGRIGLSFVITC